VLKEHASLLGAKGIEMNVGAEGRSENQTGRHGGGAIT
jgi:hypothetical protein